MAVFSPDALSWKSYSNASSAALGKYMDWTREDFEAFFADSANEAGFEDAWNALSQFGNDHVQGAAISDEDAMSLLQAEFDKLALESSNGLLSKFPTFPCEGIDFSGTRFHYTDLTGLEGLSGEQFASIDTIHYCDLPKIDVTGLDLSGLSLQSMDLNLIPGLTVSQFLNLKDFTQCVVPSFDLSGVDLSNKALNYVDFTACTGLTGEQIFSANQFIGVKLPAMDLTGVDFTGKNIQSVDFTRCTGLTAEQILSSSFYLSIYITGEQYSSLRNDLPVGKTIYVDGVRTSTSHTN